MIRRNTLRPRPRADKPFADAIRPQPSSRRLAVESLEDRRMLNLGDLLQTLNDPDTNGQQAAALFGNAVAADGSLTVVGAGTATLGGVSATGCAYIFNSTTGAVVHTLNSPSPEADANFGVSVAVSGTTVVVGTPGNNIGTPGPACIFDAATGNLLQTLNDPAPSAHDYFGASVAVSGSTVVVGAPSASNGVGSVYIFDAATGNLVRTLGEPTVYSQFGLSVGISGSTVVVGADADAAYVFDATTGSELQTLNDPTPTAYDYFGSSVAVSGSTVVVGASGDSTIATNAGRAYIFDAVTGNLVRTLSEPTPAYADEFGGSVAVSGNIVVVGASNTGPRVAGSAYVFDATGNLLQTLNGPPPPSYHFGFGVAVSGNTVVVGAPYTASDIGSAYLFDAVTGNQRCTLADSTPSVDDYFGSSVAMSGTTVVGGSPDASSGVGAPLGSAYVLDAATGNLLWTLYNPASPNARDYFGQSVAVSGSTVVVGGPGDNTGASGAGSAYIYDAATGNLLRTIHNPAPQSYADFGESVAVSGNTVVVGSPNDNTGATDAGSAYLYDAATGKLLWTLHNPKPQAYAHFGQSVGVSGNMVAVGAPYDNTGATNAGLAYIFDAATGKLLETLHQPVPAVGGVFGYSVSVSGSVVAVGQPYSGVKSPGSAYLFDVATGNLLQTLHQPNPAIGDYFGGSVAVSGTTVAVGAPARTAQSGTSLPGSAYLFDATAGNLLGTFTNPTPAAYDGFGFSVAVAAGRAVVAAPYEAGISIDRGAVYVFDATPPTVVSVRPNLTMVTDNSVGAAKFQVRITYDTDMKLGSTPTLTFTPDVAGTLTQSAGWWINSRTYYAQYDVKPSSVNFPSISLVVLGGQDSTGNTQAAYNGPAGFSIDTADPAPTPASVQSAQPSLTLVSGRNVGQDTFAVVVTYSESMRWYGSIPTIGFSDPAANAVLQLDPQQSWWTGDTTYKAVYTVLPGTSVNLANLGITVSGALDPTGNPQTPYTGPTTGPGSFSIDTLDAPPPLANVKSITTNLEQVTAANTMENAGPDSFVVWVQYDQPMLWYGSIPTLSFVYDPNWYPVAGTLQLDLAQSWWTGPDTYVARFTVQNYYTIVNPSVGIAVTGAKDAIGNAQADYSGGTDVFEVNTAATAPLASVTGVVPSAPVVTTANLGKPVAGQWTTGFVERITYDQSMAGYSPVVTLTANDPTQQQALNNTLSFDAAWSWWVSDTTFRAAFDVADSGFSGSAAGFTIHVKWARSNTFPYYDEVRYSGPANFSIDTQRPTVVSVTQSSRPQILSLTVVYSKAMQGTAPTFGFGGPIFGEIGTFVPYGGWWTSSTTYVETFLVLVDGPFPLSNLYIWGARDLDGNVQVGYPGDFMPLDTLGPGQTSLTDAVLSSGALNLSVGTSTTSMDDQQSAINPIDKALALTGTWLDV